MSNEYNITVEVPDDATPEEEQRLIEAAVAREADRIEKELTDRIKNMFK